MAERHPDWREKSRRRISRIGKGLKKTINIFNWYRNKCQSHRRRLSGTDPSTSNFTRYRKQKTYKPHFSCTGTAPGYRQVVFNFKERSLSLYHRPMEGILRHYRREIDHY